MTTTERLFGASSAFDHSVTTIAVSTITALLAFVPLLALALGRFGVMPRELQREILIRTASWAVIVLVVVGPILLGAFWAVIVFFLLAVAGHIEYARVTGLFRDSAVSWAVLIGIACVFFAVIDHWYGFFTALAPLGLVLIAGVALLNDRPKGYVQRVALGVLGFLLFAVCLGHLAYFGNSAFYRPILILVLSAVAMNDIFAYTCGKAFGKRKLCPSTSPNKTIAGALGALVLTTLAVVLLGQPLLAYAPQMNTLHLAAGGLMISICGQLGDLMLSAIKRDIGVKDTGVIIPGHGGLLDRLDSLLLTAPACFHFIGFYVGVGLDQQTRIISGG
ncbi:MAG: phosphatidate cytidylyltransferase [Planctomycetota bacterium]